MIRIQLRTGAWYDEDGEPMSLADDIRAIVAVFKWLVKLTLLVVVYGYACGLVMYLLLRLIGLGGWWVIALLNIFIQWLLLPSFIVVPIMLIRRRWLGAGLFGIHALAFLWLFGGLFLPENHAVPADSVYLKIMTFNIASYTSDPAEIVQALRESEADMIGLQEVSSEHGAIIEAGISDLYPYRFLYTDDSPVYGKAFFSRYPIMEQEAFTLASNRPHLDLTVDIDGQAVQVYVFHPSPPAFLKYHGIFAENPFTADDFTGLLRRIDADHPTLILCDCNMNDQSLKYQRLEKAGFSDTFREAGFGFGVTFPADAGLLRYVPALIRLDYIWTSAHFIPLDAYVGEDAGSDHLPMIAEVALR